MSMTNIVFEINTLVDFLYKKEGHEKVAEILSACSKKEIKGFVCAHEIPSLVNFLKKSIKDKTKIKKSISGIFKLFTTIEITETLLNKALLSETEDFETALIEVLAIKKKAGYILTRDPESFKKSVVRAVTPEELLGILHI